MCPSFYPLYSFKLQKNIETALSDIHLKIYLHCGHHIIIIISKSLKFIGNTVELHYDFSLLSCRDFAIKYSYLIWRHDKMLPMKFLVSP